MKAAALTVLATAVSRYGDRLGDEQEVLTLAADIVIDVFASDSVTARAAAAGDPLHAAVSSGDLELQVHDFFSDKDLWRYLSSLDVSVLPYRFGTHSGWLEACRDLGTTVVVPSCGYFAEQGPVLGYVRDERTYDERSLAAAVIEAYESRPDLGATVEARREQRRAVAEAHERIYASVVDAR